MSGGAKLGVAALVSALLGGVLGAGAGLAVGFGQGAQLVVDGSIKKNAADTAEVVALLEKLRAAKGPSEAITALEVHLDRHVYMLLPGVREGIAVQPNTVALIDETRAKVVAYRTAHPRTPADGALARDVDRFLETGE